MTAILIIFYNNFEFLIRQHEHLKLFCKDEYELIVVDNSSDEVQSEAIRWHAENLGLEYVRTKAASVNGSQSHAYAANFVYWRYKDKYDILFFCDHDCIPVKPFSPSEILKDKLMAGLGQIREGKKYYWPGCFMFKTSVPVDWQMIPGFDTGGATYKAIELVGEDCCIFFDEAYVQNPCFNKSQYDFYSLIHNGTFMHFINGSNWANSADNAERLNSLFNILKTYLPDGVV